MTNQNSEAFSVNTVAKFDLPMEFHLGYLRQLLTNKSEKSLTLDLAASFGSFMEKSIEYTRIKSIKGLYNTFIGKPDYSFVRDIALQLLLDQTSKQISIVEETFNCGLKAQADEPLPHRMFSWTREDFLTRRQAPNCVWVVVLEKSLSPKCLEIKKLHTDLECLQQLLELIFAAFQTENQIVKNHVQKFIEDAADFANIFETLMKESARNKVINANGIKTVLAMNFYRSEPTNIDARSILEEELVKANVWMPIEQRYQKDYYETRTNQHQIRADIIEEKFQTEMEQYKTMVEKENFRTQCVVTLLYEEIERYKRRIAAISEKLDKDYEAVNIEISYKLTTMEKLKDQRKFYIEQIERFKEELEQSRLRKLFEEEVELNRLKKLAEWRKKLKKSRKKRKKQ